MDAKNEENGSLSPWWRNAVVLVMIVGFSILIGVTVSAYRDAPPIPEQVVGPSGQVVFTGEDVRSGQQIFLKNGLMENGSVLGHGGYLGPDFSAAYLHDLGMAAAGSVAMEKYNQDYASLDAAGQAAVQAESALLLKQNRYDAGSGVLAYTQPELDTFQAQQAVWADYFSAPGKDAGLQAGLIRDPQEIRQLTAFFAWTAWSSAAQRPGRSYSYTNNFPFDPIAGNQPTTDSVLWSALSLITLLGGTAVVLFAFGRFDYLGWKGRRQHIHPQMLPGGEMTASQTGTLKYFLVVAALLFLQVLCGALIAHYRADPGSFYGLDLSGLLPSNIVRTWHLQTAVFWIATAYIAGALFLGPAVGGKEPKRQAFWVNILFWALVLVVGGSLLGEYLGVKNWLGSLWSWLGHQGWEFLDLGRVWQVLLVVGLLVWLALVFRAISPARRDAERKEVASLFLYAAVGIPLFYVPAFFYSSMTNYTVVDTWRFWIIHLWVEGFFELFATVMVAIIFYLLGMVTRKTAARVIYLDAILFLASGIVGTGHHWYWNGQSNITMALAAMFSALEVVPLTLLTLDAWDFIKLTRSKCDICGEVIAIPHKWSFYFLMAVGFWNFVGAGVFGFLINTPIVSYYETGTMFTPNHGHSALMGVFGMLGLALMMFAIRQALSGEEWKRVEKYIRVSFWGLNIGLALMVVLSLFPGGVLQFRDVLINGYWHARSPAYLDSSLAKLVEWVRLPADLVFWIAGVTPALIAIGMTYWFTRRKIARS